MLNLVLVSGLQGSVVHPSATSGKNGHSVLSLFLQCPCERLLAAAVKHRQPQMPVRSVATTVAAPEYPPICSGGLLVIVIQWQQPHDFALHRDHDSEPQNLSRHDPLATAALRRRQESN